MANPNNQNIPNPPPNNTTGYGKDIMIVGGVAISLSGLAYIYMQIKDIKDSVQALNNRVDQLMSQTNSWDNQHDEIRNDINNLQRQIRQIDIPPPEPYGNPYEPQALPSPSNNRYTARYNNFNAPPQRYSPIPRYNNQAQKTLPHYPSTPRYQPTDEQYHARNFQNGHRYMQNNNDSSSSRQNYEQNDDRQRVLDSLAEILPMDSS